MATAQTQAWRLERLAARAAGRHGDSRCEWSHLERAHIISQPMAGRHVRTHVAMMLFALRHRDAHQVGGQLLRVVVAGPGSWTQRYPAGNTGGSNVSAFEAMPIPDDLRPVCSAS